MAVIPLIYPTRPSQNQEGAGVLSIVRPFTGRR